MSTEPTPDRTVKKLARRFLNDPQRLFVKRALFGTVLYRHDLKALSQAFGSDKHGTHFYAQHYERHFAPLRDRRLNILEIGIGGYEHPERGGDSLRTWKAYFRKSHIFGIDIHDKRFHDERRIKTFMGSQTDLDFLSRVVKEIGRIDIVIDDGSHLNEHVITTFNFLFPALSENGIYVVEDLQTSYWTHVGGVSWDGSESLSAPHTSMNFFKRLVDGLNYEEFMDPNYCPTYFDRHITAMYIYHNLLFVYKGNNNEGSNVIPRRITPPVP